jgi:putative NADPH-quinone reductase
LKGWFERGCAYGDADALTPEGGLGDMSGRVPLLHHEKALVINTTLFREEDYDAYLREPMTRMIDDWGLRYPGIKKVEHVYFYRVPVCAAETRQGYLERSYQLGKEFAQ